MAVLVWDAGPIEHHLPARELEVDLSLPTWARDFRPMGLVHHRGEPTSIADRVMAGDLLHLKSLEGRNIFLGDVIQGGSLAKLLNMYFVSPAGKYV